ncbi:hypothetical protein MIDIC_20055 [Alphaproteobacteria bacterium]
MQNLNMQDFFIPNPSVLDASSHMVRKDREACSGSDVSKVSKDFESYFLSHSFNLVYGNKDPDPVVGGGIGEKVLYSFLLNEYCAIISERTDVVKTYVQRALQKNKHYDMGV